MKELKIGQAVKMLDQEKGLVDGCIIDRQGDLFFVSGNKYGLFFVKIRMEIIPQ